MKTVFAKSVFSIYPDLLTFCLDLSSSFSWGLFCGSKNQAITTLGSDHPQCSGGRGVDPVGEESNLWRQNVLLAEKGSHSCGQLAAL